MAVAALARRVGPVLDQVRWHAMAGQARRDESVAGTEREEDEEDVTRRLDAVCAARDWGRCGFTGARGGRAASRCRPTRPTGSSSRGGPPAAGWRSPPRTARSSLSRPTTSHLSPAHPRPPLLPTSATAPTGEVDLLLRLEEAIVSDAAPLCWRQWMGSLRMRRSMAMMTQSWTGGRTSESPVG